MTVYVVIIKQADDSQDWGYKTSFNWVVAETFSRITNPKYVDGEADKNRYLTWKAANEDIQRARQSGYKGKLYLTLIALRKENEDDGRIMKYARPLKNERPRWKWSHKVISQIEITKEQLAVIKRERHAILKKIRANRGAKLSHFPLGPKTAKKRKSTKSSGD